MIFYYSATGNTEWMAKTIAEGLGDRAVDLTGVSPEDYSFGEGDLLGICFPVFACTAPPNVSEFARRLKPNGAYVFAVCDYSNYTGHTLQNFSRDVLALDSGFGLLMPDNTSVLGKTYDNEETTIEKMRTAPERLDQIISKLRARPEGVFESHEGDDPNCDKLPDLFFNKLAVTEPFRVDAEKCVGCGLCERTCPAHVIELDGDRRPVWTKPLCYQCSACINNCPKEAIDFGEASVGVKRYHFRKYRQYLGEK